MLVLSHAERWLCGPCFCNNEATVEKAGPERVVRWLVWSRARSQVAEQLGEHSPDYGIVALHEQMPSASQLKLHG